MCACPLGDSSGVMFTVRMLKSFVLVAAVPGGKLFQESFHILEQQRLVLIDLDGRGGVFGVNHHKPIEHFRLWPRIPRPSRLCR